MNVKHNYKKHTRQESDWPRDAWKEFRQIGGDSLVAAVKLYTGNSCFGEVNKAISSDDPGQLKKWGGYIFKLKRSLSGLGKRHGFFKRTCYRGFTIQDRDKFKKFRELVSKRGRTFLLTSFASASCKRDQANNFAGNVLLEIDCSKDRKKTSCVSIAKWSQFPHEEEVLFLPYSGFKVVSSHERGGVLTVKLLMKERKDIIKENAKKQFGRRGHAGRIRKVKQNSNHRKRK